jgi:hypothetical protein
MQRVRRQEDRHAPRLAHGAQRLGARAARPLRSPYIRNPDFPHIGISWFSRRPTMTRHNQFIGTLMNEFEKLAALLDVSALSERAPLIDRVEAAKLAARWGRPAQRACKQPVGPWMQPRDSFRPRAACVLVAHDVHQQCSEGLHEGLDARARAIREGNAIYFWPSAAKRR